MKTTRIIFSLLAASLLLAVTSQADFIWDNGSADGQWKTPTNWTGTGGDPDNTAPTAGSTVRIENGDIVNWDGNSGQNFAANLNLTLSGNSTLTAEDVLRLNNATLTVNSGSTLSVRLADFGI